jgi:hypothetical protein
MSWTLLAFCLLISRTLCQILTMAISDNSDVQYVLSHIIWYLIYIAAIVSDCTATIGMIMYRQHWLCYIAILLHYSQWKHQCDGATGEQLTLGKRTQVTFAPESMNLIHPGILSPWKISGQCISKMHFGDWEPLGVSESRQTRITGWSNPRVYWTHAVVCRCT